VKLRSSRRAKSLDKKKLRDSFHCISDDGSLEEEAYDQKEPQALTKEEDYRKAKGAPNLRTLSPTA
jgi:hypothetical protein